MTDVIENVEEILVKVEGPKTVLGQQIYVYVPFASLYGAGIVKPDGETLTIGPDGTLSTTLNLQNGEGVDSLVQVYSGELSEIDFQSKATAERAVSLGESNEVRGRRSLSIGKSNVEEGDNSIIGGLSNQSTGSGGITLGELVRNLANRSIAVGLGLENSSDDSAVFCKYNIQKTGVIFVLGNGTSDTNRSNAFEVLLDGRAKVYGVPIEDDDVVRLEDLSNYFPVIKPSEKNVYYLPALSVNNDNSVSYWSIKATPEPSGEKVVIRSKQGRAQMQDPVDDADIANKRFVERTVDAAIKALIGLAPEELDTLEELAKHIQEHADEYAVVLDAILKKADLSFVKEMQQTVDVITSQGDGFDILYSSDVEVTLPIKGGDGVVADVTVEGDMIELRLDPTYVTYLNRAARAIVTPLVSPSEPVIPVIGTNNAQQNVELGDGFSIKDGKLVSTKNYPKFVRLF